MTRSRTKKPLPAMNRLRRSFVLPLVCIASVLAPLVPKSAAADNFTPLAQPGISDASAGVPETGGEAASGGLGSASADPSTGIARSKLAFELPSARGQAQPHLSLSYSSTSGNGFAGWGWTLDLPSIERKNLSGAPRYRDPAWGQPLDPNTADRFVFGGQPLVPVCLIAGGRCAAAPNEAMPVFTQTGAWHYFRLANDTMLARFFWSADHRTWVVQQKSGETWEFGSGLDSESSEGLDTDSAFNDAPFRWNLVRQYDSQLGPNGGHVNRVVYRWQRLHANQANVGYLTDVYDTALPAFADSAWTQEVSFAHHARLSWEMPPAEIGPDTVDPPVWRASPIMRLKTVDVTSAPLANRWREQVRRYHLGYRENGHRTYLSSFQLEGRLGGACAVAPTEDANFTLPAVTGCLARPATTMEYLWPFTGSTVTPVLGVLPDQAYVFDVNSDGLPDFVGAAPGDADSSFALNSTGIAKDTFSFRGSMPISPPLLGVTAANLSPYYSAGSVSIPVPDDSTIIPFSAGMFSSNGSLNALWAGKRDSASPPNTIPFAAFSPAPGNGNPWWSWRGLERTDVHALGSARHDYDDTKANYDIREQEHPLALADIDGDGYPDMATATGYALYREICLRFFPDGTCETGKALVQYDIFLTLRTTRRDRDGRVRLFADYAPGATTTADIPWTLVPPIRTQYYSEVSAIEHTRSPPYRPASPLLDSSHSHFLEDMNGDGLLDWVSMKSGQLLYYAGHGNGLVGACADTWAPPPAPRSYSCSNDSRMGTPVADNITNAPAFSAQEKVLAHDINGDGLADLLVLSQNQVRVSLNLNGLAFDTPVPIQADQIPNWDLDKTKVVFADMNGSGVDDIVFVRDGAAYYVDLLFGVRPGLLRQVNNGLGATTNIEYTSTTDLARCSRGSNECSGPLDGRAWQTASPQVMHVVTKVTTTNNLKGPAATTRVTEYSYSDPIYDGRDLMFRGFQRVRARSRGEPSDSSDPPVTTETTFLSGRCENDLGPMSCPDYPVDRPFGALTGLPVLVETYDDNKTYNSTSHTTYRVRHALDGMDGRAVRFAYAEQTDTFVYDTTAPTSGGTPLRMADATFDEVVPTAYRNVLDRSVGGKGAPRLVKSTVEDAFGNVIDSTDWGVKGSDAVIHSTATWALPGGDPSGWNWRQSTAHLDASAFAPRGLPEPPRDVSYRYNALGNLTQQYAVMRGIGLVDRHHETSSAAVAGPPATASVEGTNVLVRQILSDVYGNPIQTRGPRNVHCEKITYDPTFQQLPTLREIYTQPGCTGPALATQQSLDRGLGKTTLTIAPDGATTTTTYDGFGRPATVVKPSPSDGGSGGPVSQTITYSDAPGGPVQWVRTTTFDGAGYREAWAFADGLGSAILNLRQADPSAGDQGDWVVDGAQQRSAKGSAVRKFRPFFWSGAPTSFPFTAAFTTPATRTLRDAFGRVLVTYDEGNNAVLTQVYRGLSTDTYDAENLPGRLHAGAYTTTTRDGHGRVTGLTKRTTTGGPADAVLTSTYYTTAGQVSAIAQSHAGAGDVVWRYAQYDSFGRMVDNVEPNTTSAAGGHWRYAFDDDGHMVGTSDARGCGKNIAYDAVGRVLYEDYSPCLASHAPYTPASPNGTGTEAFYFYDQRTFGVTEALPTGRLNAAFDRATGTVFEADGRGRLVQVRRRIAKPGIPSTSLVDRYTPHLFVTNVQYDELDRPTLESTGADSDLPALLGTDGASNVTTAYSARGTIRSVSSSYGPLVASVTRDESGHVLTRQYADAARTLVTYEYDPTLGRLARRSVTRTAPDLWSAAGYPPASASEPTQQLELENTSFGYDGVGNVTGIADVSSSPWPSGAKPRQRAIRYDDFFRVANVDYGTPDAFVSPLAAEEQSGAAGPVPVVQLPASAKTQAFAYDWLGNTVSSTDDVGAFYDRSLGAITNGIALSQSAPPNRITHAESPGPNGGSLDADYDASGNLVSLSVRRYGPCAASQGCIQSFGYDWDEVGQLARARRWDGSRLVRAPSAPCAGAHCTERVTPPPPPPAPTVDLHYTYDGQNQRVVKTARVGSQPESYTVSVFGSLRLEGAKWDSAAGDYERTAQTEKPYLVANGISLGRVIYTTASLPSLSGNPQRVFLELSDGLGSNSFVIDYETGELVERMSYQPYGGIEADYRPARWGSFRETDRFTGKEDDVEIGLTYFGARYYSAPLGRWLSPDPVAIHQLQGDLNPYAYVSGRTFNAVDPTGLYSDVPGSPSWDQSSYYAAQATGNMLTQSMSQEALALMYSLNSLSQMQMMPSDPWGSLAAGAANLIPDTANLLVTAASGKNPNFTWADRPDGSNLGDQVLYGLGGAAASYGAGVVAEGIGLASKAAAARFTSGASAGADVAESAAALSTNCFVAGTPVATKDGLQPIETLRAGDVVLSRGETGEMVARPVVRTFQREAADLIDVTIHGRDGADEVLHTTAGHPFWIEGRGWVTAGELTAGAGLWAGGEAAAEVAWVAPRAGRARVFNFEVAGAHTYLVGAHGVWVHNACGGIQANLAQGVAFEAEVAQQLQQTQTGVVQQLTIKTQSGVKLRLDFAGTENATSSIGLTEAKSSATARLTANQKVGFPEVAQSGATVVGKGKPGFPGGTQIPPTQVVIVRP